MQTRERAERLHSGGGNDGVGRARSGIRTSTPFFLAPRQHKRELSALKSLIHTTNHHRSINHHVKQPRCAAVAADDAAAVAAAAARLCRRFDNSRRRRRRHCPCPHHHNDDDDDDDLARVPLGQRGRLLRPVLSRLPGRVCARRRRSRRQRLPVDGAAGARARGTVQRPRRGGRVLGGRRLRLQRRHGERLVWGVLFGVRGDGHGRKTGAGCCMGMLATANRRRPCKLPATDAAHANSPLHPLSLPSPLGTTTKH